MDKDSSFDIIIVGLGPVGALMANLLGQFGLSILVIERTRNIHPFPRAIHFDGEIMRVFQNAGLASSVKKIARSTYKGMHFIGSKNETLLVRKGVKGVGDQGWENNWYFFQPELEKVLREGLQRHPNVTVRLGETVTKIKRNKSKMNLFTEAESSENYRQYEGSWIIGCDGAKSLVSKCISSEFEDLGLDEQWLVVDLKIRKGSLRARKLPDYTIQYCDPERPMTSCYINSLRRRWEIMIMPTDEILKMNNEKFIWSILKPWLCPEDAEIERAQIYTFHSIIKKFWSKKNIVLAGDSAHQSPPFLGQGLCAGIRDVSALAWRLRLVVEGKACPQTIDSYANERKSHVREFIDLAVNCGKIIKSGDQQIIEKYFNQGNTDKKGIFNFPKPQLGLGDWVMGDPPLGQISPQFLDDEGSRSDDCAPYKFILYERVQLNMQVSENYRKILDYWDVRIVIACREVARWLDFLNANAALVRPDRYLYGVAKDFQGVIRLITHFENAMTTIKA